MLSLRWVRPVRLLLLLVFIAGLGGQAFGRHMGSGHAAGHPAGHGPGHAAPADPTHGVTPAHGHAFDTASTSDAIEPGGEDADDSRPDDSEDLPCTCLGMCHGTASAPLAGPAPHAVVGPPSVAVRSARPCGHSAPNRLVAYLLPFANGPPAI